MMNSEIIMQMMIEAGVWNRRVKFIWFHAFYVKSSWICVLGKRYYLKVETLGGKAFLDHLSHEKNSTTCKSKRFVLHLFFKSQRFKTKPVDCRSNPSFQEEFIIDVGQFESKFLFSSRCMLIKVIVIIFRPYFLQNIILLYKISISKIREK